VSAEAVKRCSARLPGDTWSMGAQCNAKPSLQEADAKGLVRDWCAMHAPSRVAARDKAKREKWAAQDRQHAEARAAARRENDRRVAVDALLPELLTALGDHPLAKRLAELLP
jgi:hypothetical protein